MPKFATTTGMPGLDWVPPSNKAGGWAITLEDGGAIQLPEPSGRFRESMGDAIHARLKLGPDAPMLGEIAGAESWSRIISAWIDTSPGCLFDPEALLLLGESIGVGEAPYSPSVAKGGVVIARPECSPTWPPLAAWVVSILVLFDAREMEVFAISK